MTIRCFLDGDIRTLDPRRPRARALVAKDERIVFLGDTPEALAFAGPGAERIPLGGRLVLPGFIDDHVHFVLGGNQVDGLDLRGCRSPESFRERTRAFLEGHRDGWILGGDWDQEAWGGPLPHRSWLDPFSPDTPVLLQRFDAHMAVANSRALALAGIGPGTPDPAGGRIDRDADGSPTGILRDAAMAMALAAAPEQGEAELDRAVGKALGAALALGVTSVQDISDFAHLEAYRRLDRAGALTCRVYARTPLARFREARAGCEGRVRTGSVKAFADGSLGSNTAWFFDPYLNEPTTGLPMEPMSDGRMREWALEADRMGLQLSIHAIGDRAVDGVLAIFEEVARVNPPWDRRFRIEHAQHVRPGDVRRMAALGVIASAQPYHCVDDGCWAEGRIGRERASTTYAFRSFLEAGVPLCFGSDWTVAPLDPILGVHAAVTRATLDGKRPGGWFPEQRLTVAEAVLAYTLGGAYASFEEHLKGSLAPGKFADLAVLTGDIFSVAPERIPDVRVAMTVVGGEVLYERPAV
jgi:hypothetical protein